MDFGIYAGDTNKTIYLRLRDSTTGLAKTGLAYNSAGAVCSYTLPLAARAAITLATQTVTGAHSDGGFVEVDATNCKGLYRLDLPDAAIASGAFTVVSIEFDGIIEESVQIPLHTRKVNVTQWLGTACATPTVAGVPEVDLTHIGGDAQSGTDLKDFADAGYDPATNKVQGVVLVDTTTTNTDMVAAAPSAASVADAVWDEALSGHAIAGSAGEALSAAGTAGDPWTTALPGAYGAGTAGKIIGDNVNATISSRAAASALATAQADLDTLTGSDGATLATAQALYAPAKAGDAMALTSGERTTLAAAIWNALTSGMTTVGSIGKKLADWTIHSAADVWAAVTRTLTAATNITSTGGTTVPQTGDSFARLGAPAGASVSADIAAVKVDTAATLVDTAEIGAAGAGLTALATAANLATVDTVVDAIKLKTDLLPEAPAKNSAFTYTVKMVDETDGYTPETGLTITATRSIDGGTFASATGTVTEISGGTYKFAASAADMNGDVVTHRFAATGARTLEIVIQTTA